MARTKGILNISSNFEPQIAGAFDARLAVEYNNDLILDETWTALDGIIYPPNGLTICVFGDTEELNGIYFLPKGKEYNVKDNWIKSSGGTSVISGTNKVVISINPNNIGNVSITALGINTDVYTSPDLGTYTIITQSLSDLTINLVCTDGYQVSKFNIDTVNQGAVSTYKFTKISSDHTGYVWLEEKPVIVVPPEYTRSDLTNNTVFNSLKLAVASLVADYGDNLTEDVTIKCTKQGVQYRINNFEKKIDHYNLKLSNFNQNSMYKLTIDGDNILTVDGNGLGGFNISSVDNLIIKNITFRNCYNWEGNYAPEFLPAINIYSSGDTLNNVLIENVTINGQSTKTPSSSYRTFYGIYVKDYRNVTIKDCNINNVGWNAVKITNANSALVTKCFLHGNLNSGMSGHPYIIVASGIDLLKIMDCEITAPTFNEFLMKIGNVDDFTVQRNNIHDSAGGLVAFEVPIKMTSVKIAYNSMQSIMLRPLYSWDCTWIKMNGKYTKVQFSNNYVSTSSAYYQEFIFRGSADMDQFISVNNIFVDRNSTAKVKLYSIGYAENIISRRNIYKFPNGCEYWAISALKAETDLAGVRLSKFEQAQSYLGVDEDSWVIPTQTILLSESGGTKNALTSDAAQTYRSLSEYTDDFDITYHYQDKTNTPVGCENIDAISFDETSEDALVILNSAIGFELPIANGVNLTLQELNLPNSTFDLSTKYVTPANTLLLIKQESVNRNNVPEWEIESQNGAHRVLGIGKTIAIELEINSDENGEFVSNNTYDIKIK